MPLKQILNKATKTIIFSNYEAKIILMYEPINYESHQQIVDVMKSLELILNFNLIYEIVFCIQKHHIKQYGSLMS